METITKPSTAGIALKWGAISGLASIIYNTILEVTGLIKNEIVVSFIFVFLLGGIYYGLKEFKTQNKGYMAYGEGFGLGTLVSAVCGLVSSAFVAFYIRFIDDSNVKQLLESKRQEMRQIGMEEAIIKQKMQAIEMLNAPGPYFIIWLILTLITGFIFSLVISALMKNERTELA